MTFDELIDICDPIEIVGKKPSKIGLLTQDSREVQEGSVFIAIRGTLENGHTFIESAISAGAAVIICEDLTFLKKDTDVCGLEVKNTRSIVGPLAQAFEGNPSNDLTLIGVTGTNGKTTVVTLVYQILKSLGVRVSMLGTISRQIDNIAYESRLTTSGPVELAGDMRKMVDSGSTHLVMEVSSHALEQERVRGCEFEIAAFTNLSQDHLDYHDTIDKYANAKKKLFDRLSPQNTAVINADDDYSGYMIKDCPAKVVDFGFENVSAIPCELVSNNADGLLVRVRDITISSPLIGKFNAYNLVTAFLICESLQFEVQLIADILKTAPGAPGRLERVISDNEPKNQPAVFVDYAHTPDALDNVLATIKDLKSADKKLHVIFGCGGDRDRTKRPAMAEISEKYGDRITVTSDNPRNEDPEAIIEEIMTGFHDQSRVNIISDRREAIRRSISEADKNTIVLIAGKGHETYQEVKGEKHPFDDRKIAGSALNQKNDNTKPEGVS